MRTSRPRHFVLLLVLVALLATVTLLITTNAYADDDAAVLDDVQLTAIDNTHAEVLDSLDQRDQAVQLTDGLPEQASGEGQVGEQGGGIDEPTDATEIDQNTPLVPDDAAGDDDLAMSDDADEGEDPDSCAATDPEIITSETSEDSADAQNDAIDEAATPSEPEATEAIQATPAKPVDESQALTPSATTTTLNGVDISGWNVGVDFSKLGNFVIIKATQWNPSSGTYTYWTSGGNGSGNGSLSYTKQADAALKAGKLIGFYHFFVSPNYGGSTGKKASAVAQAKGFINAISVKDSNGKYKYLGKALLVLDWEDTGYSSIESHVSWAKEWLDYVYLHTGVKPVIYMNYNCANAYNWSSVAKDGYELWGARYFYKYYYDAETGQGTKIKSFVSNPTMYADNDRFNRWGAWGKKPLIYQYTATCNLHGSNNYDANKFYGTKADWENLAAAAHEISSTVAEAAKFLTNNAVYSFSPTEDAKYVAYASSGDAVLGNKNYRNGYWIVKNLGEGLYSFINFRTGKALSFSPSSGKVSNSTDVTTAGSVDKWRLIKCSNGAFALVPNGFSSYRLDVAGGKILVSGTNLGLHTGNGTASQRFFFTKLDVLTSAYRAGQSGKPVDEGIYAIKSALGTNMVLEVKGGSTANAANIHLYKSNKSFAQRFQLVYQGNGLYSIRSFKSGKLVEVANGSSSNGANVQQYASKLNLTQLWYFKKVDGVYKIYSAKSGKVIDIVNGQSTNGTNVQVYASRNTNAQKFSLVSDNVLKSATAAGKTMGEGVYSFTSVGKSKAMEIQSGSTADKANVRVHSYNGSLAQKFQLAYQGNGLYVIRNAKSLKVLSITGNSSSAGANVEQFKSNGNRAQFWYVTKDGDAYRIHSALNGQVLTVSSSNNVYMDKNSSSSTAQQFKIASVPLYESGTYTLKSSLGNYRISVKDGTTSKGGNIQLWATSTHLAQRWKFTYLGSGLYSIVNVNSGLAMEVANGSTASNANVQQNKYTGANYQKWQLVQTSTGVVIIRNAATGMVLDVANGVAASGSNIRQRKSNNSAAQSFVFASVS